MKAVLPHGTVADRAQHTNNQALLNATNAIGQFVFTGTGVPTFTPPGPAIYFRQNFAVNASVYVWDGSWKSVT